MKFFIKILAFVLSAILIFSIVGCDNNAQTLKVYNTAEVSPESQVSVALNPVISYKDEKYDAFEQISKQLETDISAEEYSLDQNTAWHWMFYDEGAENWVSRAGKTSKWTPVTDKDTKSKEFPDSYAFTDNGTTALVPFVRSSAKISPYDNITVSKHGIVMSVTGDYEEGLCFIVPKSGKITISDPNAGRIMAVRKLLGFETETLANDFCDRAFQVIFYHNGKPIWAAELGNPRHYDSDYIHDGCYSVEFPEISDIAVEEGDLISIVVKNLSDARTALSMMPPASEKFKQASSVVTKNGKTYIEHNGKPYLFYGVQIRPDRAISAFKVTSELDYKKYIEPFFAKTAEVGFETIIFPIHWKQIEILKDKYTFDLLKRYYDYAKKYDLKVQLLWFGSDVCGWSSNCPDYIKTDTKTYSRLKEYPEVLNLYDADTIEREMLAFGKMLDFLYEYDTDMRTVCIQIENEANAEAAGGPNTDSWTDKETVDATTWFGGQKDAVYNIMDALGRMVKQGPYRCVTRTNIVWYQCMYNGVNDHQLREVGALEGLDLVGLDSYQSSISRKAIDQTTLKDNIPHYAEFGSTYYFVPAQTMMSLESGGGLLIYHLKAVDEDSGYEVFGGNKYEWLYRSSEKIDVADSEPVYGMDTYELIAFNKMMASIGESVTSAPMKNIGAFNCSSEHTVNPKETKTIAGQNVTFTNRSSDYGGSGLAVFTNDNEWLLLSQHGTSSFTFDGKKINGPVSVGRYDNDKWVEESTVSPNGGTVTLSDEIIKSGAILRVTAEQLK